jgi:methyl-accepting chemotaxis protein
MIFKNAPLIQKMVMSFTVVLICSTGVNALIFTFADQAAKLFNGTQQAGLIVDHLRQAARAQFDQTHEMQELLLTGVRQHVDAYIMAADRFHKEITDALATPNMEPDVQLALQRVESASATWRAQIGDPAVKNYSEHAYDAALAIVKTSKADELHHRFQDELTAAEGKINAVLSEQNPFLSTKLSALLIGTAIGGLLTLITVLSSGYGLFTHLYVPMTRLMRLMIDLAAGTTDKPIPYLAHSDEIGAMARAIETVRAGVHTRIEREQEAETLHNHALATYEADQNTQAERVVMTSRAFHDGLEQLAQGNLFYRIETKLAPSLDALRASFNESMSKLQQAIQSVQANAGRISAGAGDIAGASDELSKRTEKQAANVEQTTTALTGIGAAMQKTALGAKRAQNIVFDAKSDAEHSGEIVRHAIHAMSKIEKSSQEISQIIGVIDEIAFQTNLLALNAGVEAARAGEAGRGFAVVAAEVRALAQRSADSAREIKTLISTSSEEVEEGVKLVSDTGASLDRIATKVAAINEVVSDIAANTQTQSLALQELSEAVAELDKVTQDNATMAEKTTAASQSLAGESTALTTLLTQFNTGLRAPVSEPDRHLSSQTNQDQAKKGLWQKKKTFWQGDKILRQEMKKTAPHMFRQNDSPPSGAISPLSIVSSDTSKKNDWQEY